MIRIFSRSLAASAAFHSRVSARMAASSSARVSRRQDVAKLQKTAIMNRFIGCRPRMNPPVGTWCKASLVNPRCAGLRATMLSRRRLNGSYRLEASRHFRFRDVNDSALYHSLLGLASPQEVSRHSSQMPTAKAQELGRNCDFASHRTTSSTRAGINYTLLIEGTKGGLNVWIQTADRVLEL